MQGDRRCERKSLTKTAPKETLFHVLQCNFFKAAEVSNTYYRMSKDMCKIVVPGIFTQFHVHMVFHAHMVHTCHVPDLVVHMDV